MFTIECVRKAKGKTTAMWLIKDGNIIVGILEKYRDTKDEKHPWKAFRGHGIGCEFINSFYPNEGGKNAAIQAITQNDMR